MPSSEAKREYNRRYRELHREALNAAQRERNASGQESKRAYNRQYYARRREELKANQRARRTADRVLERERYRRDPSRKRAAVRRWQVAHPDMVRLKNHRRRALKRRASGSCSLAQLADRVAFYGARCWVPGCGKMYEAIDHVIPLSKGGANWPANLRPICTAHNSQKRDLSPTTFLEVRKLRTGA